MPSPASGGTHHFAGALLVGMGSFILLLYFGVIPWRPVGRCRAVFCDPYHWQVCCFGLTFLLAGLAFFIPPRQQLLGKLCSAGLLVALVAGLVGTFTAR